MKNKLSLLACVLVILVLIKERSQHPKINGEVVVNVTTWDALGYYMYLPAVFIYHDYKQLKWFPAIDSSYALSGGWFYQAGKTKNGNYVFKYLGGVAIMQSPFFFIAHWLAPKLGYKADGFSKPYQYAIVIGLLLYSFLAFLILRLVLLRFFTDIVSAFTLLLLGLASNYVQYAAIDSGQSHAYIFLLYSLVIYATIKWHQNPKTLWACCLGFVMGLAAISRPTEAIIFLIPLLWNTHTRDAARQKWAMVKQYRVNIGFAAIALILGILPQLLYWKSATGSFIYDVGSKWDFANPHFRVLFGFEKGWFIYTPVAILMVAGFFFVKSYPFRKSILWFCILNIYIIIGWHDWRYGGSYSTRALVQSYPVFSLALGAFIAKTFSTRWKYLVYVLAVYLIGVNLFQIDQYNKSILHYNDMNRAYYSRIYLNSQPTPLDMSALDTNDILKGSINKQGMVLTDINKPMSVKFPAGSSHTIYEGHKVSGANWLKIEADIKTDSGFFRTYLCADIMPEKPLKKEDSIIKRKVRLFSPISNSLKTNPYLFYVKIPEGKNRFRVYLKSEQAFQGTVKRLKIIAIKD